MKARDPRTQIWKFFIDKCLPFGSSISCALFQRFSSALCHMVVTRVGPERKMTNYLDDFLFLALTLLNCNSVIQQFLRICKCLNIPVSFDKTEWGSITVIFLGILLDGENMILAVPLEKRKKALELLMEMISKKKTTVKKLQQLCGYLNFICRAVFPGHPFVRRMYAKFSGLVNVDYKNHTKKGAFDKFQLKYKQHYHVRLDKEFKLDCQIWVEFLQGELQKVVNRPMVDIFGELSTSKDIQFSSDASAAPTLGFGCVLKNRWIRGDWETHCNYFDVSIGLI